MCKLEKSTQGRVPVVSIGREFLHSTLHGTLLQRSSCTHAIIFIFLRIYANVSSKRVAGLTPLAMIHGVQCKAWPGPVSIFITYSTSCNLVWIPKTTVLNDVANAHSWQWK